MEYSVIQIRFPMEMRKEMDKIAAQEERSLNWLVVNAVEKHYGIERKKTVVSINNKGLQE